MFSAVALKDLTKPGLYTSHDGETHTARIAQYYLALKDGQFPPRFAGEFYNRFESPIFVYIYPFPYLLGALLHLIGFSFANTFKIEMALSFIFSGFFCFLWLKEYFKGVSAAFLGAMMYAWSPYRFSLIYVRGSLSEALAYTFVPLSLFFLTKLKRHGGWKYVALSSISLSLILLSQNLVAVISLPIIALYLLMILALEGWDKKFVLKVSISFVWAFLISTITYVPSLFERKYIVFDKVFQLVYNSHFVTIQQLIRSPWGYGFDLPGTVNDEMSFELGIAHLSIIFLFIILLLYKIFASRLDVKKLRKGDAIVMLFIILIIVIVLFLTLEVNPNKLLWKFFTPIHIIDIPWRFLGLVPLIVAFMGAYAQRKLKTGIFLVFLTALILVANRNHIRINKQVFYSDKHFVNFYGTATQLSEFAPSTRSSTGPPTFTDKTLPMNTASGWASYENIKSNSKQLLFNVDVISDLAEIRINKFYFPGISLVVDGKKLKPFKDFRISSETDVVLDSTKNTNGFIFVTLPKGNHDLNMEYGETNLRLLVDFLSATAIVAAIVFVLKSKNA